MSNDRREFMQIAGAAAAVTSAALATARVSAQTAMAGQFKGIKALAFDAYGTLFDVFSVTALCEQLFPGKGSQLAQVWRVRHLPDNQLRATNGRLPDFLSVTPAGPVWGGEKLKPAPTPHNQKSGMHAH